MFNILNTGSDNRMALRGHWRQQKPWCPTTYHLLTSWLTTNLTWSSTCPWEMEGPEQRLALSPRAVRPGGWHWITLCRWLLMLSVSRYLWRWVSQCFRSCELPILVACNVFTFCHYTFCGEWHDCLSGWKLTLIQKCVHYALKTITW